MIPIIVARFVANLVARRAAQHVSVAALAIGTIASLLGVSLAPEQVSALVTAASVLVYVVSQLRGKA